MGWEVEEVAELAEATLPLCLSPAAQHLVVTEGSSSGPCTVKGPRHCPVSECTPRCAAECWGHTQIPTSPSLHSSLMLHLRNGGSIILSPAGTAGMGGGDAMGPRAKPTANLKSCSGFFGCKNSMDFVLNLHFLREWTAGQTTWREHL